MAQTWQIDSRQAAVWSPRELYCSFFLPVWRYFQHPDEEVRAQRRRQAFFSAAAALHVALILLIAILADRASMEPNDFAPADVMILPKAVPRPVAIQPPSLPKMARLAVQRLQFKLPPALVALLPAPSSAEGDRAAQAAPATGAPAPPLDSGDYTARLSLFISTHSTQPRVDPGFPAGVEADILIRLDADGNLLSAEVRRGSSYAFIDDDALLQLRTMGPFPRPPKAPYLTIIQWSVNPGAPSLTTANVTQTRLPNPAQQPPPGTIHLGSH